MRNLHHVFWTQAEAEADAELIADDSYDEVQMSPPSNSSSGGGGGGEGGETSSTSVREKIKVFSGGSAAGSSIASAEKTPGRSPFSRVLSRGWSQAGENDVNTRGEPSSAKAKDALATFGRSTSGGSRPDNSWMKDGVRGPDTAGGSSADGKAAAAAAAVADATVVPLSVPSDPEELAMKRKAFVKQYSQSGTNDLNGDSDYSLHDNAAAIAIASAVGKPGAVTIGRGHEEPAREEQQFADGGNTETPKRGRSQLPVELDGDGDDERTRARRRPSPAPSYTVTKEVHVHTVEHPAVLTMSDSGSPRLEI